MGGKTYSFDSYDTKKRGIIEFIEATLLSLVGSIFFCLSAILTQVYVITIFFSIILLFAGLLELVVLIVYSLE